MPQTIGAQAAGPDTDEFHYRVTVIKIISFNPKRGVIFLGRTDEKPPRTFRIVFKGENLLVSKDDIYEICGHWEEVSLAGASPYASKHQLVCDSDGFSRLIPAGDLIRPYLMNKLPGMGPHRTDRLLAAFPPNELANVLRDPDRIEEVAAAIQPSLTSYSVFLATQIHLKWREIETAVEALNWMAEHGVTDRRLAYQLVGILGEQTLPVLKDDPYILAPVVDWGRLDTFGQQILRENHGLAEPKKSTKRLLGAVDSVIKDEVGRGNTAVLKSRMPGLVARKLGIATTSPLIQRAIELASRNDVILDAGEIWRAPGCALMEMELEARFKKMVQGQEPSGVHVPTGDALKSFARHVLDGKGIGVSDEQFEAVCKVIEHPLAVLTGGAGTGKTYTTQAICAVWEALGGKVRTKVELAALAGKAALRIQQVTGRDARTIHRLLAAIRRQRLLEEETGIQHEPILDNRTLLIVDEASMVDLGQWHRLFEAMPPGCRILMVGDAGQLPPIGFGLVFHLLAEQDNVTAHLTEIKRTSHDSGIPKVAQAVRNGQMPTMSSYSHERIRNQEETVIFIDPDTDQYIDTLGNATHLTQKEWLSRVIEDAGGFSTTDHETLVVSALRRGERDGVGKSVLSCQSINSEYVAYKQSALGMEAVQGFLGQWFCVGDPVIHNRNNYNEELYNGSLGHVTCIDIAKRSLAVRFEDGLEREFPTENLIDLDLAYAITCHRAQGSQAERIIIPLVDLPLIDITWLYTAITRASKQCIIIAREQALKNALIRPPIFTLRCIGAQLDMRP